MINSFYDLNTSDWASCIPKCNLTSLKNQNSSFFRMFLFPDRKEVRVREVRSAAWTKPGWTRDTLEERDTQRHEERKKWCRIRAGNEPRIYRSPSGGCGCCCCCCSRIFLRRASTTGFSYWVFLFIWLAGVGGGGGEDTRHKAGDAWLG